MASVEKANPFADWVIVCDGVRTWIGKEVEDETPPPVAAANFQGWMAERGEDAITLAPFYEVLMRSNADGSIELVCLPPMLCTGELVLECSPTSTIECRGFSAGDQAQWAGRIAEAERLRAGKAGAG